jgi:hypothetical protein
MQMIGGGSEWSVVAGQLWRHTTQVSHVFVSRSDGQLSQLREEESRHDAAEPESRNE